MSLITSKNYNVHYYEIDAKKRALISTIMNYLMDICSVQSDSHGVGVDYLIDNNKGWILTQWNIKLNRYPVYGEEVKVSTRANSFYKYYAYRTNYIEDSSSNLIVDGRSIWLLVDTNKRRPIKVSDDMYQAYNISKDETERFTHTSLKPLESWDNEKVFDVRYSDIDTNQHVNNVKYVSWIIESIPLDIALDYEMCEITVVYKKETYYGHKINVHTKIEKSENGYVCKHDIINEDGEDLTLATTYWR
jgi:medium-chain acyl-[acyl-carrier-protein] hydrolase